MSEMEVFKNLMEDDRTKDLIKLVAEWAESQGENREDALDFFFGVVAQLYADKKRLIANLEVLKYTTITACIDYTMGEAHRVMTGEDKTRVA